MKRVILRKDLEFQKIITLSRPGQGASMEVFLSPPGPEGSGLLLLDFRDGRYGLTWGPQSGIISIMFLKR
ncbi:MAG: hypothetical protein ACE5EB_07960 [Thermodesulfobacteriota bacterium]